MEGPQLHIAMETQAQDDDDEFVCKEKVQPGKPK